MDEHGQQLATVVGRGDRVVHRLDVLQYVVGVPALLESAAAHRRRADPGDADPQPVTGGADRDVRDRERMRVTPAHRLGGPRPAGAVDLDLQHEPARTIAGETFVHPAINEVSLLRETRQTAKLEVTVNDRVVIPELACDGILAATPAGSTAYNLSANGPILPLGSAMIALTPISAFRPRRWRGAILPEKARITLKVLEAAKRPVSAVADQHEVRDVAQVDIAIDRSRELTLLFDPEHALDDRITMEQFAA